MNHELLAYAIDEREYALQRLHYWLRYEGMLPLLGGAAFFLPYGLVLLVLVLLTVAFAPYMVWQLWRAGWFRTLVAFAVFVVLPFIGSRFVDPDARTARFLLTYGPLATFYLFTWGLRHVIGEQLSIMRDSRYADYEREKHAV